MRYDTARNKGRGKKEEYRSKKGHVKIFYVRSYGDHEWWMQGCSKHWVETNDACFYIIIIINVIIIIIINESEPESRHVFPIDFSTSARFSAQQISWCCHLHWVTYLMYPSLICGNKTPTRCYRWFLLQSLLLAQHVSGTIMPIIRSSRVLHGWLLPVVFGAVKLEDVICRLDRFCAFGINAENTKYHRQQPPV